MVDWFFTFEEWLGVLTRRAKVRKRKDGRNGGEVRWWECRLRTRKAFVFFTLSGSGITINRGPRRGV